MYFYTGHIYPAFQGNDQSQCKYCLMDQAFPSEVDTDTVDLVENDT